MHKLRVKSFAQYIAVYGEKRLLSALQNGESQGLLYHYPGKLTGDYDQFETKEEIWSLLNRLA